MNIHILGIVGQGMTTPLALELKRRGHYVSGSDQQKVYPPASTDLAKAKIPINSTPISKNINLAIIGSSYKSFPRTIAEFKLIKKLNIPYLSATKYIANNLVKKESILIAGAFGKSTISSLVAQILTRTGYQPSYLFGAKTIKQFPSLKITDSNWSVVEADESINGLDRRAKFLYYPVKHVIISSTQWEHKESYPNSQSNTNAFKKLIKKIPPNGTLIYNPNDPQLQKLKKLCRGHSIPYSVKTKYDNQLLGLHNQQNIAAATTLCRHLNIDSSIIKTVVKNYSGLKRRLQIIKKNKNIIIIDDFAQSATRINSAIQAIKHSYPNHSLKVFFEAHASFLQTKPGIKGLGKALKPVKEIILAKLKYQSLISKSDRVTVRHLKKEIGQKLTYLPNYQHIQKHYLTTLKPKQVLIHFSSGGLLGLKTLKKITNRI